MTPDAKAKHCNKNETRKTAQFVETVSTMGAGCPNAKCAWPNSTGDVSQDGSGIVEKVVLTRSAFIGEIFWHDFLRDYD